MLDEIERLFPQTEAAHGDSTQLQQQVQRFNLFAGILRALGQEGGDRLISLVIADRQPLFNRVNSYKIPGIDTNPFYRFFQEFYLKPLEPTECREMISEIGHAMGLEVEEDVLSAIYSDSGGFPALARQLASAAANKRGESVKIDSSHYHQGIAWLREERGDIDRFFKENFRDVMNNAERRILALAANENGVPMETLETDANTQDRERIIDARRDMLAVGILEKIDANYRVSGALFRQWIKENRMMNDE
jgi:DNA polymerase III delta prime subunit